MKKYFWCLCFIGFLLTRVIFAHADTTVVCLGDSITRGIYLPPESTFPAQLGKQLKDTKVINAGVSGNTSTAGLLRFDKDVTAQEPQYVVIFFGTNDSVLKDSGKYKVPLKKFMENLRKMVTRTRASKAQPILCTLLPILPEPYFKRHPKDAYEKDGGLEAILQRYHDAAFAVGKDMNVPVVDLYTPFSKDLTLLRPAPDGVHPTAQGAEVIANEVAKVLFR